MSPAERLAAMETALTRAHTLSRAINFMVTAETAFKLEQAFGVAAGAA